MRRLAALGGLLVVILIALAVAQVVLPGIAASRLRGQLRGCGPVRSISVSAFPAVELLWHHADSVEVHLGRCRMSSSHLAGMLDRAGDVNRLTVTASEFDSGLLTVRDATLRKAGSTLTGTATITEADLRHSLPIVDSVTPVASGGGRITLRGTATLLGITGSVDVVVGPQNGVLLASPQVPFGGLATLRLFSDPHLAITGVGATPAGGGFTVTASGILH